MHLKLPMGNNSGQWDKKSWALIHAHDLQNVKRDKTGNSRYNTGYRKYGRETPSTVFDPVPGYTYPGSRTVHISPIKRN
jgi:hypothetical protein